MRPYCIVVNERKIPKQFQVLHVKHIYFNHISLLTYLSTCECGINIYFCVLLYWTFWKLLLYALYKQKCIQSTFFCLSINLFIRMYNTVLRCHRQTLFLVLAVTSFQVQYRPSEAESARWTSGTGGSLTKPIFASNPFFSWITL